MNILTALQYIIATKPQKALKTVNDRKQEALIQQGKMQFEKLIQKGLSIPVALL